MKHKKRTKNEQILWSLREQLSKYQKDRHFSQYGIEIIIKDLIATLGRAISKNDKLVADFTDRTGYTEWIMTLLDILRKDLNGPEQERAVEIILRTNEKETKRIEEKSW